MKSFDITKEFSGKEVRTSVLESYLHLYTKEGWRVVEESEDKPKQSEPCKLDGLETKDKVEEYVLNKYNINIDKRGSLETVKEKAKAVINESKRVD